MKNAAKVQLVSGCLFCQRLDVFQNAVMNGVNAVITPQPPVRLGPHGVAVPSRSH